MSDTPETDAACETVYAQGVAHIPLVGFMEKLERERDEARRIATELRDIVPWSESEPWNFPWQSSESPKPSEPFQNQNSNH